MRRPCGIRLWAGVSALAFIGAAASIDVSQRSASQPCSPSLQLAVEAEKDEDELQLLQLQTVVAKGEHRAVKPGSPRARLQKMPAMDNSTDIFAGFARLLRLTGWLAEEAGTQTEERAAALRRSLMASQLVFGFNGKYCERRFGGLLNHHDHDGNHGPEILNTMTAVFIFFVGIYELAAWNHQSAFIRLLCALVVMNGWASAARHFGDIPFCAVLDGMTMVVGAVLGCCFMVDLATQRSSNWFTIAVLRVTVWAGMPILFCLCFFRNPHSFDPHTSDSAFRYMFALPLVVVAACVYGSLWCNWVSWTSVDPESVRTVKSHLMFGVPICCLGGICLGISELFCDDSPVAQYFPGHALWHLLFPFGVNALLLYICALWADTKHQPMAFYKGVGWKARWYGIAPAFTSFTPVDWEQ